MRDKPTRARDRVRRLNARARRPPGCDRRDQLLSHFVAALLKVIAVWAGRTGRPGPIVLGWKELRRAGGAAPRYRACGAGSRSEEHTSELQSHSDLVCRLLLEKKNFV